MLIVVYHMLENFTMKINGFLYHYMECMNVEKKGEIIESHGTFPSGDIVVLANSARKSL